VLELSSNMTRPDDPSVVLLPAMERLRDELGETVSLYVRDRMERVRIQAVQSEQAIRRVAPVGARLPLTVGASSKVLLAFAEDEVRREVMDDPSWPDALDRAEFVRQLDKIRAAGYATSFEEREPGAAAVSAPIFGRTGKLVAALAVSGPSNRLTPDVMHRHAPAIMEAARRMGKLLG
jgi:DNA-binding IclR family transcriptional regulator